MKLIIGLGNPGKTYSNTRHNIGSRVVERLAKDNQIVLKRSFLRSCREGRGVIEGSEVVLAIPLSFMNLSGKAAGLLIKRYKAGPGEMLVVCDDLDLDYGRIKIKAGGSSAGHKGLESIMYALKTKDFHRLRLGIGRPGAKQDPAVFVLSVFSYSESKILENVISRAVSCCQDWINKGIDKCMEKYNSREQLK